jgi:acyl-CoA thioester hydrolase
MKRDLPRAQVRLVVPFHDCDPLQVVWHGRYLEYFELARTELFASHGLDVPAFRDLGHRMYVSDVRCRYMYPLAYGEQVEVSAQVTLFRPLLRVAYSVRNLTKDRRSARGYTVLAVTDAHGQLLPETPDAILERFLS